MKVAVVDLGCGNIGSVRLAVERFGLKPLVSADAETIATADRVILPGVGAAGFAMERIDALGLRETLVSLEQPALGICLGMQLLFESSEEEETSCLGLIAGRVRKLQAAPDRPVPHMGWTQVAVSGSGTGIVDSDYFYFAHSYACDVGDATVATADYGRQIAAVVQKDNWTGVQFHPERSGAAGARLLASFLA